MPIDNKKSQREKANAQLEMLMSQVKKITIKDKKKIIKDDTPIPEPKEEPKETIVEIQENINEFPNEQLSDFNENDDEDDIIAKFKHNTFVEYETAVLFQKLSINIVNYARDKIVLKLSDNQKRFLKKFVWKIYQKMVLMQSHIMLESSSNIYEKYDDIARDFIFKIKRDVLKLYDLSIKMKKRISYNRNEIISFFNVVHVLYSNIVNCVDYLDKTFANN
jgi:hypothetical protein